MFRDGTLQGIGPSVERLNLFGYNPKLNKVALL